MGFSSDPINLAKFSWGVLGTDPITSDPVCKPHEKQREKNPINGDLKPYPIHWDLTTQTQRPSIPNAVTMVPKPQTFDPINSVLMTHRCSPYSRQSLVQLGFGAPKCIKEGKRSTKRKTTKNTLRESQKVYWKGLDLDHRMRLCHVKRRPTNNHRLHCSRRQRFLTLFASQSRSSIANQRPRCRSYTENWPMRGWRMHQIHHQTMDGGPSIQPLWPRI